MSSKKNARHFIAMWDRKGLECIFDLTKLKAEHDEWEKKVKQVIFVSATPGPYELKHSGAVIEQVVRPTGLVDPQIDVRPATTQVDDLLSEINKRIAVKERVLVTTLTKRMAEDLTDYLGEHGIKVRYLHSDVDTDSVEYSHIFCSHRRYTIHTDLRVLCRSLDLDASDPPSPLKIITLPANGDPKNGI